MKSLFFSLILFLTVSNFLVAQTLKGKVKDELGRPISGVNILHISKDFHTHTDDKGQFTFENLSLGDTLLFTLNEYIDLKKVIQNLDDFLLVELEKKPIHLDEFVVNPKINAINVITDIDIQTTPVNSSQDILRKVPGLFIGQHAGGGKAEQIFLRGFDIDHGTDINVTVDGLPVNMVSHAHGQGYADLHFVIPETINKIDFGKGPYYDSKGNFTTAGYVDFISKEKLDHSSVKLEGGQFNTLRMVGMFNLINSSKSNAYVATEYLATDGPFESPQNFNRKNIFGKYTGTLTNSDKFGITVSHFSSRWDASGQIPQRAVDSGMITRFGAIDDTEGGNTSRSNFLVDHEKFIDSNSSIKSSLYLVNYNFELFSNFTFFLEDPENGDQIKQKENRSFYGFKSEYRSQFSKNNMRGSWNAGVSLRADQTRDSELSHTRNRTQVLEPMQLGDINETNLGAYVGTTIDIDRWTFNPSIRVDYFDFQYQNQLLPAYKTQEQTKGIISPKFTILYNQSENLQLYFKTGKGFHSNDTRVVIAEEGSEILPAAYGLDAGFIWKPSSNMLLNLGYWNLYLEQEFVYVGDAGIVEPSGKTSRQGLDLSYRYQPVSWLFWNLDVNYTHARAIEEAEGENFIPLAPDFSFVTGLNLNLKSGVYGSLNVRHMNSRPANEDNSIVAKGYTVTDLNMGYKLKKIGFGIQIQNLLNTEWNETQFATESRLQNEDQPVEEIHFTPGTPFFLKALIQFSF